MHSIRIKIMAVMIAAILTTVLFLGGVALINISRESDRSSVERMNMLCDNLTQRLDSYLNSLQQSVDTGIHVADETLDGLDMSLFSTNLSEEEQQRKDTILAGHCAEVRRSFASIASNLNAVVTYYYCVNSDLGSSEHGFFWSKVETGEYIERDPLISSELDINDTEHTVWYYAPLKAGRPVWVGPYTAHFLGDVLCVSYVAPVYRYGFLIGVLGMDILFDTIVEHLKSLQVYGTGFAFLMDNEGKILYHPTLPPGENISQLTNHSFDEAFKRSSSGNELIRYSFDGVEKQLAFSTLRNKTRLGITVPVSEITENEYRVSRIMLIAAGGLLVVFGILTLIVVTAITRPLLNLASASRQLMDGNYDVKLDYHGKDEIGVVTQSFIRMRDHMHLYINDLNSRAYRDAMTGIRNKGAFDDYLTHIDEEIRQAEPGQPPAFAIVVFDCNDLKVINDSYGHDCGDEYLKTASRLICRVYEHSPVFRLGGDEFGVILQNEDYENRDELLKRFDQMTQKDNHDAASPWQKVNIAKGMAVYTPGQDQSAADVFTRADQKMYRDKKDYHS